MSVKDEIGEIEFTIGLHKKGFLSKANALKTIREIVGKRKEPEANKKHKNHRKKHRQKQKFNRWTSEEEKTLLDMKNNGKTIKEIAKALNRTKKSVELRFYTLKKM